MWRNSNLGKPSSCIPAGMVSLRIVISSVGTITRSGLSDNEEMFRGSEAGSQRRVLVTHLGCDL